MRKAQPDRQVSKLSSNCFRIGIEEENEDEEEKEEPKKTETSLMPPTTMIMPLISLQEPDKSCGTLTPDEDFPILKKLTIESSPVFLEKDTKSRNSRRRLTLPITSIELEQISSKQKSKEDLPPSTAPVTSSIFNFNSNREGSISSCQRPSTTNIGVRASITPSLAGIFPDPCSFLNLKSITNGILRRSVTVSNLSEGSSTNASDDTISENQRRSQGGRRWSRIPFLRPQDDCLNRSQDHHHHHHGLSLHIPTFTFTGPSSEGNFGRKFNFGLRRHSHLVSCEVLDGFIIRQLLFPIFLIEFLSVKFVWILFYF